MFLACVKTPGAGGGMELDTDSVGCLVSRQGIEVEISADYPTHDTLMQSCLSQYIVSQMLASIPDSAETEGTPLLQSCGLAMWNYIRQQCGSTEEELAAMSEEDRAELPDPDEMVWNSSYTARFPKVYDNGQYVSWQCTWNLYVYGAAHPSAGHGGVTFCKSDGRRLGFEILKNQNTEGFRALLRDALAGWIREMYEAEADTDEQLETYLNEGCKASALPLPRQAPYLLPEGVAFSYQEHELIAANDVQVLVIPYNKMRPYLAIDILG